MADPVAPRGGLEGMAALVTGGGSGIGLGCALRLAADGAHVTICGRGEARLVKGAEAIRAAAAPGVRVEWITADVTVEDQVEAAVRKAASLTGRLDAVIASAGGADWLGPVTQLPLEAWRRVLSVNADGTFLALKHAAPIMVQGGGGSFVGISSIAGARPHRWFGAYGPAKSAIEALCLMAADELGASGVRVNAVRPGLVATDLTVAMTAIPAIRDDYLAQMPLGRVGQVEDIAALCRFLVGPEASWITGQVIGSDGGHALRRGPDFSPILEGHWGKDGLRGAPAKGGSTGGA
jgi:NAD(P)-dependent dehydrogenase (short-subunit alcohol dehydrogenase family)